MEEIEKIKKYKALYNKRLEELEQEFEPMAKEVLELTNTYLEKNAVPIGTKVIFNDVNDWMNEEGVIIDYSLTNDYRIRYFFDTDNYNGSYCGFDNEFKVKIIE
jgi:wobble nucleotide-excising tRNase